MTALEIDRGLTQVMMDKWEESKQKLAALPADAKTERKAVQIEIGMYSLFVRFGQLYNMKAGNASDEQRNHVLYIREQIILREGQLSTFPKIKAIYESADAIEKQRLIATWQGEIQMRCQMYSQYVKHWESAKQNGNAAESFEAGIKVAVVEEGFRLWEQWRKNHQVYPDLLD